MQTTDTLSAWIEQQIAQAPPIDEATARRISALIFGGDHAK